MKKGDWLAGLGLLGACALCCALPLLGGVAILGVSSFFLNPLILAGMALMFVIIGIVIYQQRKANGSACTNQGCGCKSCVTK
ncbi:hypothetical protein P5G65_31555 [Paenibacillus chondroitinus]|uniref:Mercuric ion transport protein n=1 Tax=Paenibacillus chondroitinus TaxID=59842 RepID=A0ABU6DN90_9BACL|nr:MULTISPECIES: hypothetical protein [Paenibacillus]MCY9657170.1 hypothetical protein [Paenibacillus anseongense]MEB4798453.1 hypothetical protein [Paenibacillus chondroitinus]